jgi:hypothetical protein
MTCLAAWAAIRPRVSEGMSISRRSPGLASGLIARASSMAISAAGSAGLRETVLAT